MKRPGFVDLQINGYHGIDFNQPDTTVDAVLEASEILAKAGTAGYLATVITGPREAIERNIATLTEAIDQQGSDGNILGIHLEGPFLSPEYGFRGAHPEDCIGPPDAEWFAHLQEQANGNIKLLTVAPEQDGASPFIDSITPDVLVAAGHTCCAYEAARAATDAGMSLVTHIGNGCRQQIDRHDNPIFNLIACPELNLCFIPDGFHLPEGFIRMLLAVRSTDKLVAVSDAQALAGMPPGRYQDQPVGGDVTLEENGKLRLTSDPNVLAGSTANMMTCMNYLAELGVSEDVLWQLGYENPLRVLGMDPKTFDERPNRIEYDPTSARFTSL